MITYVYELSCYRTLFYKYRTARIVIRPFIIQTQTCIVLPFILIYIEPPNSKMHKDKESSLISCYLSLNGRCRRALNMSSRLPLRESGSALLFILGELILNARVPIWTKWTGLLEFTFNSYNISSIQVHVIIIALYSWIIHDLRLSNLAIYYNSTSPFLALISQQSLWFS